MFSYLIACCIYLSRFHDKQVAHDDECNLKLTYVVDRVCLKFFNVV